MTKETTSLINQSTKVRLKERCKSGESYDDFIVRLLDFYDDAEFEAVSQASLAPISEEALKKRIEDTLQNS